jgi:hypothetical protein
MATHIRAQCAWQVGSMLPRDAVMITPCFRHQLDLTEFSVDYQTLCDDLSAALNTWASPVIGNSFQSTVKLYKIGGAKPNRPQATKVINVGNASEAGTVREVACCLSFYGGPNAPKNRGRLYIPVFLCSASATLTVRPSVTVRQKVADLVPLFAGLGGTNVDWGIWSPTYSSFTKADHYWVDDEWDIQRKRGLKPTTRTAGTTSG